MEIWWLVIATVLALAGAAWGWRGLKQGDGHAFWWMAGVFGCQLMFLQWRGELRGRCPLDDIGEISVFVGWSLTLFYLAMGSVYRVSLLGLFSVPLVVIFHLVALWPGALEQNVIPNRKFDAWGEAHAAFSVLSYGALALSAVAAVMFLTLNQRLKKHSIGGGLAQGLPSVHRLLVAMGRITLLGWAVLSVGVVTGFLMEGGGASAHLYVALGVWLAYAVLLGVYFFRGIPGRHFAYSLLVLFAGSLLVFANL